MIPLGDGRPLYTPSCQIPSGSSTSPKELNCLAPLGEGRLLHTPSCQISPGSDMCCKGLNGLIFLGEGRPLYTPNCKKCTTSPKGLNGLIPLGEERPLYTPSCQISPVSDISCILIQDGLLFIGKQMRRCLIMQVLVNSISLITPFIELSALSLIWREMEPRARDKIQ